MRSQDFRACATSARANGRHALADALDLEAARLELRELLAGGFDAVRRAVAERAARLAVSVLEAPAVRW